ncbi:hypothetical protein KOI35_10500 [Actinoplanes bogorensis]|uniref:Uncharacterized protein n=1 Tax=Paractinoplanes bogorensis TaxID=1610840 RepID=A0ABS5YME1_9ACTN|nr:hypothetical protein [Actinoplanes bogorensis]MBU2663919.1 hypothetical protein [Actinoplanes bogorensis]
MTDNDHAVRILRTLPDQPPAPSTVDVARTMTEGRRRRRMRRWAAGTATAAVTVVAAAGATVLMRETPPAPAPPVAGPSTKATPSPKAGPVVPVPTGCQVTKLPTSGVTKALTTAGDPSGRYHAGRVYPDGASVRTVIWDNGKLRPVPAMPGLDASFEDINSSGVAVGYSFDDAGEQAYVLQGTRVTRLAGGRAAAAAINDAGVIVGTLGESRSAGFPARWSSPSATPVKLPMPSGFTGGDAVAVGEDGTVVGRIYRPDTDGTGYLWLADGTARLMPMPTVDGAEATAFWPESISGDGVFGRAVRDDGEARTFASYRYRISTGKYEPLPAELGPPAIGATNGRVLGTTNDNAAVMIAGTEVVKLPKYQGLKEYVVTSLSADGKVASGYSTDTTPEEAVANRPLTWTCR